MGPRIAAVAGPIEGTLVPIEEELTVGRSVSNRLALDDPSVADRHCLIRNDGGRFTLRGLGRHSRTFVNGLPARRLALTHGDQIRIGASVFLVLLHEEVEGSRSVEWRDLVPGSLTTFRREDALSVPADRALPASPAIRERRELDALLKISTALSSIRGLAALERPLLELILEIIPAERGAVMVADTDQREFASVSSCERQGRAGGSTPLQASRTIAETALRQGVALLTNDLRAAGGEVGPPAHGTRSVLAVPMVVFDRVLGVIYLETTDPLVRFDEGQLQLLTVIAGIAAMALDYLRHVERLERENRRLEAQVSIQHDLVGESPQIRAVHRFISKVAPSGATVLIRGESGTGKEVVARALHRNSPRAAGPFVVINCAAIAETLIESELFGHERGAFTGALSQKSGKLEVADGGTVFLDEIVELPFALQAKLLRVLQELEFERVGGTRPVKVDIRLIAATNVDVDEAVADGRFRSDLYYRLNVVSLTVPPLRERRGDIRPLAGYFAARHSEKIGRRIVGIAREAEALLTRYDWPGNVRELEHVIERALIVGSTDLIQPEDLPEEFLPRGRVPGYHTSVMEVKKDLILKAVEETRGNYVEAARRLRLNPNYLHRLIRSLDLKATLKRVT